jgi:hypothetical protein
MATVNDLANQSKQLGSIAVQMRDRLTQKSKLISFLKNPSQAESLLTATNSLKSQRIVLYGLKEALVERITEMEKQSIVVGATTVDVLPSRDKLDGDRPDNWLSEGDIIGGWIGYLADRPRVIDQVLLNGYRWHFLGDDGNVKGPGLGFNQVDKWLKGYGFVQLNDPKLPPPTVNEIHSIQQDEINALLALEI